MKSFEELKSIIATLRSENGCPWDREQTHQSLKSNLLEETYEIIEAIESNDSAKICEELGDLLFTIINLSRHLGISAENALRKSNKKFIKRFQLLECEISELNKTIDECSSQDLNKIWDKIKSF